MKRFLHGKGWVLLGVLFLAAVMNSTAQVSAPEDDEPDSALSAPAEISPGATADTSLSWREIIKSGGWLMYVMGVMSVVMMAFVFFFAVSLRPRYVVPRTLRRELLEKIKAGALDDAAKACEYHPSPFSSVVLSALQYLDSVPTADPMLLKDVVEGEGSRQADVILGPVQYLLDLAVIAPMVGLFGTVLGMLHAFGSIAHDIASAKPVVLAEGVSQALITTAFGLAIGIPAMMFYSWFRRKASRQVAVLEAASSEVMTALLSKDRIRPRTGSENSSANGRTA